MIKQIKQYLYTKIYIR